MMRATVLLAAIPFCLAADRGSAAELGTFVSIPPQVSLVERIGGDRVEVRVLVPAGQDPHTFEATPKQAVALMRAKLFFKIGMPFEARVLEKIQANATRLTVVDTSEGIEHRMTAHQCDHPDHLGHHHHHAEPDPHIWMSPPLLRVQAANIAKALAAADPAGADVYAANLAGLQAEIDAAHAEIAKRLKPFAGRTFFVFHPALGYFADAYGLKEQAVEVEGKSPSPRQLRSLIAQARQERAQVIFAQPQFDQRSAEVVAQAIGGSVATVDPLQKDVLANLKRVAEQLESAMKR